MKIWWLNQLDCEAIGEELPPEFPQYLKDQFSSRYGRAGRGRLWVDNQFRDACVDPWPDTELSKMLAGDFGGIVIHDDDAVLIKELSGIITDMKLERV